jgi:Zn-dependent alcohol dehydrogenase
MARPRPFADSRPLVIEDVVLADPGPGEVRIRIRAAGLCHSDLSVIDGSRPRVMPMVLGHEAAGEVLEVHPGTIGPSVGDQVVFSFVPICGRCPSCAVGRPALCEAGAAANAAGTLLSGTRRLRDGQLHQHLGVSAFSEEVVVDARSCVTVDPELAPEIAALFGCAVLTGVGAVVNTAQVRPGESCAIVGLGGVGLAALLGAITAGAHPIVGVDRLDAKLALALELGADHAVVAGPNAVAEVRSLLDGGADHVIETVGNEQALADSYAMTRRGGATTSVGLPDPSRMLSIPAVSLVAEERTLRGSYLGGAVPSRDIPRYIALYRAGRLPVHRLLSHRIRLDQINEGFDRLADGDAVRQVIVFD